MKYYLRILFLVSGIFICGCAGPKLAGTFDGKIYTSAQRDYSVPIPVTDSGGRVAGDDERGVTFRDDMGMRVSFYSLQIESESQIARTLKTDGRQQALDQYLKILYHGVEPINFHPEIRDGTSSFIFLKGGENKTSGAAFINENRIYLVEFDLPAATKALWLGTEHEQDKWLEDQAVKLVQTIQTK